MILCPTLHYLGSYQMLYKERNVEVKTTDFNVRHTWVEIPVIHKLCEFHSGMLVNV